MPLTVTWNLEEAVAVVELSGALTLGPSLGILLGTARQILQNGKVLGLAIRVGQATIVDSSGIGELTVVYTISNNHGCGIRLFDVPPSKRRMLQITCIDKLLPESKDLASAKAELQGKRAGV